MGRIRTLLSLAALVVLSIVQIDAQTPQQSATRPAAQAGAMVNLNTATSAELQALPGIGPAMATRILDYRQKNGPFKKIEEVMNVQGIGEKVFLNLRSQLTVGVPASNASNQP